VRGGRIVRSENPLSIELLDLRGRVVDRFSGNMADYQQRLLTLQRSGLGRTLHIVRAKDLKTGKVFTRRVVDFKMR